jgi:hypothetical protein
MATPSFPLPYNRVVWLRIEVFAPIIGWISTEEPAPVLRYGSNEVFLAATGDSANIKRIRIWMALM